LYRFKPEYSNNYEIGTKNNLLQNRLRINVSLFYSTIENAQVPTLILPDAITVTKNAGKLSSKGIELELAAAPVKGLQVDYNAGYTNASYKTLKLALYGNEVDLSGNKQIFTPEVTSMLAAQYSYEINARQHVNAFIRGEWMYLGKEYFDLANTIQQNPYSLFNAKLGVSVKKVDIFLWGRNLADKKYIAYAYDFGAVHLGNPKTYGVTFRLMFR
jgi:iron complex outermembrane receptor protein